MKENSFEIIGAFVDRERVDPELLKQALSSEEGREYLIDLVALREVTVLQPAPAEPTLHDRPSFPARPLALVAALVIAVGGGYFTGLRHGSVDAPAAVEITIPTRVEPAAIIPPAPTPTRVIQLEPGVDFKESAGG